MKKPNSGLKRTQAAKRLQTRSFGTKLPALLASLKNRIDRAITADKITQKRGEYSARRLMRCSSENCLNGIRDARRAGFFIAPFLPSSLALPRILPCGKSKRERESDTGGERVSDIIGSSPPPDVAGASTLRCCDSSPSKWAETAVRFSFIIIWMARNSLENNKLQLHL